MFNAEFFVALSFFIFLGLVIYLGLPKMVLASLDKRSEDIKKEIDDARNIREEAQKILAKEKKNLEKADSEVKNLFSKAEEHIKDITSKAEEELKQDIERKKKQAELKIEQAKSEALNDVKRKAAELSFQITKKYLEENIDSKTSTSIIDESILFNITLELDSSKIDFERLNKILKEVDLYEIGRNDNSQCCFCRERIKTIRQLYFL